MEHRQVLLGKWKRSSSFWDTQPLAHNVMELLSIKSSDIGADYPSSSPLLSLPLDMSHGLNWCTFDLSNEHPNDLDDIVDFLRNNYVEDAESKFRFSYSKEFLQWALLNPGYHPNLLIGLRDMHARLRAFISAYVLPIATKPPEVSPLKAIAMVNFLCIDKEFRGRDLAPILISELTKKVHLETQIFQAIFSTERHLSSPVCTARFWHFPLKIDRLISCEFISNSTEELVSVLKSKFHPPKAPEFYSTRPVNMDSDAKLISNLLLHFFSGLFEIFPDFASSNWIVHLFTPRPQVIYAYLVYHQGLPVGFFSIYSLPSQVLSACITNDDQEKVSINTAFLYYAAWSEDIHALPLLISALHVVESMGFDVFNVLNATAITDDLLEKAGFVPGDGFLRYDFRIFILGITFLI